MCKTIKQKVQFAAPPKAVYELLTDGKKHRAFSGLAANFSKHIGGNFTAYGDHIKGVIVDLAPSRRVVLAWRTKNFAEGIFSMAAFTLSVKKNGGTELTLVHRGVPKDLIPKVEAGWRTFYWQRMKEYLKTR
jgi:uncharacterized protein YndB with AHSA1/START domain